ncbi:FAD-dependent oxidoreductase [Bradyrhizobium nitroreducens]|nr:FAD-dependent oxidoreductase [Bradyrhizobium nitroreducens]
MSEGRAIGVSAFSPGRLGTLEIKNRFVLAATSTELADDAGFVTDEMIAFYAERARGGAGLVIVEATYVHPAGRRLRFNSMIHDDNYVPGLRRLASAIADNGGVPALQLAHGGRESRRELTGYSPIAPSSIPSRHTSVGAPDHPLAMTRQDIAEVSSGFVAAAGRAREAGFKAIELHACHGYLLSQFLSPDSNRRIDEYGGCIENRVRILCDIVRRIKAEVDRGFPVICRINASDRVEGGLDLSESAEIAVALQASGVDAISVSNGIHASRPYAIVPQMSVERGCYAADSAHIKARVNVPVMVVGRINTPEVAEAMVRDGKADFVCLSRALIADPFFPIKAERGLVRDIVPCIACNECLATVHGHTGVACTMNPRASRELWYERNTLKASKSKTIVVIGGGVAGMAAARTAANRGHRVHLIERSDRLGGQLSLAHKPPHREELENALNHFRHLIHRSSVIVHLGREWTLEEVAGLHPDHVIIAIGATPRKPVLPGLDLARAYFGWQIISEQIDPGRRNVVVGGGLVAVEVADFLATRGHHVTIVARSGLLGKAVWADRVYFTDRIEMLGVDVLTHARIVEVGKGWARVEVESRERRIDDVDSIIVCAGYEPENHLAKDLQGLGLDVHMAGDVQGSRKLFQAIEEGTLVALGL